MTNAGLERVVRVERLRHIEATWPAHQRLLHACMHPEDTKLAQNETNDNAKVDIDNDNVIHSVERGNEHESDDCGDDDEGRAGASISPAVLHQKANQIVPKQGTHERMHRTKLEYQKL